MRNQIKVAAQLLKRSLAGDPYARGLLRHRLGESSSRILNPQQYYGDWGLTWHDEASTVFAPDVLRDPRYRHRLDRIWTLHQYAKATRTLSGTMIELGVYEGVSAMAMMTGNVSAEYFGVDSFSGLSAPDLKRDGDFWNQGDLKTDPVKLTQTLKAFTGRFRLVKGWIPEVLGDPSLPKALTLSHIDVDLYEPTLAGLNFCAERTVVGGVIICDDYGFMSCPGAKRAVDEFVTDNSNFNFLHLPTGQAVLTRL